MKLHEPDEWSWNEKRAEFWEFLTPQCVWLSRTPVASNAKLREYVICVISARENLMEFSKGSKLKLKMFNVVLSALRISESRQNFLVSSSHLIHNFFFIKKKVDEEELELARLKLKFSVSCCRCCCRQNEKKVSMANVYDECCLFPNSFPWMGKKRPTYPSNSPDVFLLFLCCSSDYFAINSSE